MKLNSVSSVVSILNVPILLSPPKPISELFESIPSMQSKDLDLNLVKNEFLNSIPLNRFGQPSDVAYLACFLASEKSNYITGQTINVDGGLIM